MGIPAKRLYSKSRPCEVEMKGETRTSTLKKDKKVKDSKSVVKSHVKKAGATDKTGKLDEKLRKEAEAAVKAQVAKIKAARAKQQKEKEKEELKKTMEREAEAAKKRSHKETETKKDKKDKKENKENKENKVTKANKESKANKDNKENKEDKETVLPGGVGNQKFLVLPILRFSKVDFFMSFCQRYVKKKHAQNYCCMEMRKARMECILCMNCFYCRHDGSQPLCLLHRAPNP